MSSMRASAICQPSNPVDHRRADMIDLMLTLGTSPALLSQQLGA